MNRLSHSFVPGLAGNTLSFSLYNAIVLSPTLWNQIIV